MMFAVIFLYFSFKFILFKYQFLKCLYSKMLSDWTIN